MKRRAMFASVLAVVLLAGLGMAEAQTSLAVQVKTVGALSYPAPAAVYNEAIAAPQVNDTLIAVIPPNGNPILSDSQGNIWTQICGGFWMTYAAPSAETLTTTYGGETYMIEIVAEYPGSVVLDACAPLATGTGTAAQSNSITAAAGDLVLGYGWNATSNYVYATAGAPLTMEGFANIFLEDGMQAAAGTASSSVTWTSAVSWTQGVVALKPTLQPVTLNFGPTANALMPCTNAVTYDDGSSLFGGVAAPVGVMELENGAWVNIGTPVIQANGQIAGSVTINPNYTSGGFIQLELLVQTILNIPPASAVPITPAQLQSGATGLCGSIVEYRATQTLKGELFTFTP
jgi:hypothetical protein